MKVEILGVRLDNINFDAVMKKIDDFINGPTQNLIVTVNPEFIVAANKNFNFKSTLNSASLAVCDGFGLAVASKLLKRGKLSRITGVDLTKKLLTLPKIGKGHPKIYLLGGQSGSAEAVAQKYPANIVGADSQVRLAADGRLENQDQIIAKINDSGANVLLVAFGQVKQELWIRESLSQLPAVKAAIGVGGTFDYLSGQVRRAPKTMRRMGLEWLFRLTTNPKRAGRIFNALIVFGWLVAGELIWKNYKFKITNNK